MKVLIFSDSHGYVDVLDKAINDFKPELIYGLGDFGVSYYDLLERNVFCVRGNNPFDPDYPFDRIFSLNGFNIILTHGHTHNVRMELYNLSLFAKENNADIVFYGHTHEASIIEDNNIYYINPGSITLPYNPEYKTFAIMEIENGKCYIKIIDAITYNIYKEIIIKK